MRSYWPLLLTLAAMWGASYLFIKLAVEDIPPAAMTEIRVLAAGLLLFGYLALRLGATQAAQELRAGWKPCLMPLFAVIYGAVLLNEAVTGPMLAGFALIVMGAALASGQRLFGYAAQQETPA
jgi:drug/metabolite transporter (DMT)-like permease